MAHREPEHDQWFLDVETEEYVRMQRMPDGIWWEIVRLPTKISKMIKNNREQILDSMS